MAAQVPACNVVPEDTFRDEDGDWTHEIALLGGTCGSRRFGAGELAALAADVCGAGGDRRRHRGAQLLSTLERGAGVGEWLELRQQAAQNVDVITKDACVLAGAEQGRQPGSSTALVGANCDVQFAQNMKQDDSPVVILVNTSSASASLVPTLAAYSEPLRLLWI